MKKLALILLFLTALVASASQLTGSLWVQDSATSMKALLGLVKATQIQTTGTITGSNLSGTNTGDVTLGSANGLSLSGQALSLTLSSGSATGALSSADWSTFNAKQPAGSYLTGLSGDVSASGPGVGSATVLTIGGSTAANVHAAELLANAATSANTASAIVKRDAAGAFFSGAITMTAATISGLGTGIGHLSSAGVLSSSPVTLSSGDVTGVLPFSKQGAWTASKTFEVDINRTDSYTEDGTVARPFKTPDAALAQIVANGDNQSIYYVLHLNPGNYSTIQLNNSGLYQIVLRGGDGVYVAPTIGANSIDSSSNNDNLKSLFIEGMFFTGDVNLVGASNNTDFMSSNGVIRHCVALGNVIVKNATNIELADDQLDANLTIENVFAGVMSGGDGQAPGSIATVVTNGAHNGPNGWDGITRFTFEKTIAGADFTCDSGSFCQFREGARAGYPGGSITVNGTLFAYNSFVRSDLTISSSGTLLLNDAMYGGSLSVASGGTVINNNLAAQIAYVPSVSSNWPSPVPSNVNDALDSLATGKLIAALLNGASSATNAVLVYKDGHIKSTQTTAPTTTVNANAGTGATCSVSNATDTAGSISLTTTAVASSSGVVCDVNFNKSYNVAPICLIAASNAAAAANTVIQDVYQTTSTTKLSVNFGSADLIGRTYTWMYHCLETQ